jgi:uncharacterized protein (TIGR00645 family)
VTLSLVDRALVAGLLVMGMLSGYENLVSRIEVSEQRENSPDRASWIPAR